MSEENVFDMEMSGIQCDNHECDYMEENVHQDNYKDWVDKPCPKCGENLLTQADYEAAVKMIKAMEGMNALADILGLAPSESEDSIEASFRIQSDTKGGLSIKHEEEDVVDPVTSMIINAMFQAGAGMIETTKAKAEAAGKTFRQVMIEEGDTASKDLQEIGELLNQFPDCAQKEEWAKNYEELLESYENAMKDE